LTDDTLANVINFGRPGQGMPPFGRAYGGELAPGEVEAIVDFLRYTWDDRVELPAEAAQAAAIPALGPDETPSYEVHIAPIVKRYCQSCHRPGKENQNFHMGSYTEIMTTGDHTPNIVPGDLNSNLIRMLHREEIDAGGPMPPTKELKPEIIAIWERWVLGGAPDTAADAAKETPATMSTPAAGITTTISTPGSVITPGEAITATVTTPLIVITPTK
jgi:hypothetical protein